ncbi:MAG TPA: zf-TFIIB domain-containing protein [Stellaceae bacterium]|jgi:Zn-finger nucleic acid-binding protein|nr:zf-TFIIB domain-containing protein [Stellaceae bacterium]
MKCPNCNAELAPAKRDGVEMDVCSSCKGMWLSRQELEQLEDEAFDLGEDKKGSLMLEAVEDSAHKCPQCSQPMRTFNYHEYDLELDFCGEGHGFWLNADDDRRVLGLMKKEEKDLERKVRAEKRWAAHLHWMRSGSFFDKIKDLWG